MGREFEIEPFNNEILLFSSYWKCTAKFHGYLKFTQHHKWSKWSEKMCCETIVVYNIMAYLKPLIALQVKSFSQSQGYRRVEGDECQPGSQALDEWEPKHRVCPVEPLPEFMLLTDMNNIHRLTLESGVIKSLDQVIDVGQHRYLSAMAYSYPRNELFFVDKPSSASQNNMIKVCVL